MARTVVRTVKVVNVLFFLQYMVAGEIGLQHKVVLNHADLEGYGKLNAIVIVQNLNLMVVIVKVYPQ